MTGGLAYWATLRWCSFRQTYPMRKVFTLLLMLCALGNLSAKKRIAIEVNYLPDTAGFVLYDSLRFTYSGNRHSEFSFRQFKDNYYYLWYVPRGELINNIYPNYLELDGNYTYDSTFTAIPGFDTARYWSYDPSGVPFFTCLITRNYNPD